MQYLRRLALLGAVCLGAAVLAGPALASARPAALPNTLGTTHFLVHYATTGATAITQNQAADIATLAEQAYSAELADGYPAPKSDVALGGDARIDIYIESLSGVLGYADVDSGSGVTPSSGFIVLAGDASTTDQAFTLHTVAHELFHLIQFGIWVTPAMSDYWLDEGTAEWMGYRVDNYSGEFQLGPEEMALDCRDPVANGILCSTDPYSAGGYSRWPFFEYLAEKYGASFVKDIYTQGALGAPTAVAALADALTAKGTTLADIYDAWSTAEMTRSYSVVALQSRTPETPTVYGNPISTGLKTAALTSETVAVNHLSTRYLEFQRGVSDDSTASPACFAATLSLTVTIPAGTLSKPTFFWDGPGSSPVALSINGSTASAAIPWDTCTWTANEGFLSLPNASQNVDAAPFVVNASLSVNTAVPAAPDQPLAPISVYGQVIPVTSAAVPPAITVYGPELLKLSAADKVIRLIVESNGEGSLKAAIGSVVLGTGSLRPGNNDLRFTLPSSLLPALRRAAASNNVLTLTPVAADGTTQGAAVTRQVSIAPAKAAPKAHAKSKTKAKPKPKPKSHGK